VPETPGPPVLSPWTPENPPVPVLTPNTPTCGALPRTPCPLPALMARTAAGPVCVFASIRTDPTLVAETPGPPMLSPWTPENPSVPVLVPNTPMCGALPNTPCPLPALTARSAAGPVWVLASTPTEPTLAPETPAPPVLSPRTPQNPLGPVL